MSRLIDADALIEYIRENGVLSLGYSDNEREENVIDMIESQPTIGVWIPCGERLPEESGTYEVTAHDTNRLVITYVKWKPKMKTWELTGARSCWKIVAWRERPEPYRTEGTVDHI